MNQRTKILVIDDSVAVRASLKAMLPSSAEVLEAANGIEGLKQVQTHQPNLIFLDCQMPEMDGIEVFQRLQRHPRFCRIPVVLMSALEDEVMPLLKNMAYEFEFLSKPFKTAQLLKASHEAMKRAKGLRPDLLPEPTSSQTAPKISPIRSNPPSAAPRSPHPQTPAPPTSAQATFQATSQATSQTTSQGSADPIPQLQQDVVQLQQEVHRLKCRNNVLEDAVQQIRQQLTLMALERSSPTRPSPAQT